VLGLLAATMIVSNLAADAVGWVAGTVYEAALGSSRPAWLDLLLGIAAAIATIWILVLAIIALYRRRSLLMSQDIRIDIDENPHPRRGLMMALSSDIRSGEKLGDLLAEAVRSDERLTLELFARPRAAFEQSLKDLGIDVGSAAWLQAQWLPQLLCIAVQAPRLNTIIVVPSAESEGRVAAFREIVLTLWSRGRHGARTLTFPPTVAVDYDDYEGLKDCLEAAIARAGLRRAELCVDVTAGTKLISIAGAVATLTSEVTCMYVTNHRHYRIFDTRLIRGELLES